MGERGAGRARRFRYGIEHECALLRPDAYPVLTGRDVVALGVSPGPAVGAALAHLAALRRSGRVRSPDDERAALADYLGARP